MRPALLFLLIIYSCHIANAQRNLSGSSRSSEYTYMYQLTPKEAVKLFKKGMEAFNEDRFLHTLIDSFKTNKERPKFKAGNYLLVYTKEADLAVEQYNTGDVFCKLLQNQFDLQLLIHNSKGQPISNATVIIGNKRIQWDPKTGLYRSRHTKKRGILQVTVDNTVYCYQLNNRRISPFPIINLGKALAGRNRYYSPDYFYSQTPWERRHTGFMVFSKPMYKPKDTVKFKAWIQPVKGKPVNRPLLLRLTDRDFLVDTILATVQPYRPGAYEYSFVLSDSLELDLDTEYMLTLEEESSRQYDMDAYDGDDEDKYAMNRKVLIRNKFRHEEYELNSVSFSARTDREKHAMNTPVALYVKAVNENDMAVMDGRVKVIVTPRDSEIRFYDPKVFLKDTLWVYEQEMEAIGETKIILPDSIFPAASFHYDIKAIFLNSNNERNEAGIHMVYLHQKQLASIKQEGDSMRICLLEKGKEVSGTVTLWAENMTHDTIENRKLELPACVKIDPFVRKYFIATEEDTTVFSPAIDKMAVVCNSMRKADSLFIQIVNPAGLPAWYSIFEGNSLYQQGIADSLFLAVRTRNTKPWFVSIQYLAGDKTQTAEYHIPYDDSKLAVSLKQPEFVYPGQKTGIEVEVKDGTGEPVANADITLFGYTRKFTKDQEPQLPYTGKKFKTRKIHNRYTLAPKYPQHTNAWLNWDKWSQRLGLDSIEYYKFLYPDSVYLNYEPATDSITQIAPFVVAGGRPMAIQMLYIDDQPYFFRDADQWDQYSFELSPGLHSLKLRIYSGMVHTGKLMVRKGVKTIVSIDMHKPSVINRFEKMPDSLTKQEQQFWERYLILVERNEPNRLAYIQSERIMPLNNLVSDASDYGSAKLVGPIRDFRPRFTVAGKFSQIFEMEGGYQYRFEPGLIKMKQWPAYSKPYNKRFYPYFEQPSLYDQAITGKMVDSLWKDMLDNRSATADLFHYRYAAGPEYGRLLIKADTTSKGERPFVKNVLLFRQDDPNFIRIYKGVARNLGNLREGNYRLLLLLKNDAYFLREDIVINRGGTNYYDLGRIKALPQDSMSQSIARMISNRDGVFREPEMDYESDTIKAAFNRQYFKLPDDARTISGQVTADGKPLPGVSVTLKNTGYGVSTDMNGQYSMKVPEKGILRFAMIGFDIQEIMIEGLNILNVKLKENTLALNEVVVVGYGVRPKQSMTGSISTITTNSLQGRMAGVIRIRGASSANNDGKPLIVVDGLPVDKELSELDPAEIQHTEILSADLATNIYGARAASGVILVITKKAAAAKKGFDEKPDQTLPGNSLRTNFRDEAYWFPSLRTNEYGKASVSVVFPDDITNWKTFAIAAADNGKMGMARANVRSFKAISASLHLPNFAVAGDEMQVLGKAMNYGLDSMLLKRTFLINGKEIGSKLIGLKHSVIDTFSLTAAGDSMQLAYTLQRNDGYFDGEERKLKVFPQGVTETHGLFAALNKDSVISWQPASGSEVTLHAEASVLPVLMDEMEHVFRYEYSCNEQLASKLKALLMKRKVYGLMKKDFNQDRQILDIISKLNKAKANDNLWGWWKGGESLEWITLHVIESLLQAEEQQFNTELNKSLTKDFLIYTLERTPRKISMLLPKLRILHKLDSKILFRPWLDSLAKYDITPNLYETLSLLSFEQELDTKKIPDSLFSKGRKTAFGNLYWGEEGYRFFDNSVQNTLLMYRILKNEGRHEEMLSKIRQYFLEKRSSGHWRNTYESILILETILPDLMKEADLNSPSSLVIRQGEQVNTVSQFPFTVKLNNREPVRIEKKGGQPVYLTAYQNKWNPAPEKVDSTFSVNSFFRDRNDTIPYLRAGEPAVLHVNVKVAADVNYVMLEIPIPAGCSYNNKTQPRINNEVHREYFLNKVSVFCSELKKGSYNFTVSLLPRYTGKYNLNPAKACMMYFPVFFGREGMKKVNIR